MKQVWWHFWVLVLMILLSLVLNGFLRRIHKPHYWANGIEPELLQLADLTNRTFGKLLEDMEAGMKKSAAEPPEEEMMRCQAALIRLRAEEDRLQALGCEMRLVDGLQAWFSNGGNRLGSGSAVQYLEDLVAWTGKFRAGDPLGRVERLMVVPGSDFPDLSFELSGQAEWIGLRIRSLESASAGWQLVEIDLLRPDPAGAWWSRGNLAYSLSGWN